MRARETSRTKCSASDPPPGSARARDRGTGSLTLRRSTTMSTEARASPGTPAATASLRAQLAALQLPYLLEHFESLAQQAAAEQWPIRLSGAPDRRRGPPARRPQHPATGGPRPLSGAQDPRSVPLELAEEDQPSRRSRISSACLHRGQGQRDLPWRRRSGQDPFEHRPWPRRLSSRLLGAVHHRRRYHQLPLGGQAHGT